MPHGQSHRPGNMVKVRRLLSNRDGGLQFDHRYSGQNLNNFRASGGFTLICPNLHQTITNLTLTGASATNLLKLRSSNQAFNLI